MAVYYKKIKGKNYDGSMINMAEASVKGRGDGRISLKDAKRIMSTVKDSDDYTDTEKKTMKFIRDNYSFTPEADRWFRTEIRKWAAAKTKKKPLKKTARKPLKTAKKVKTRAGKKHARDDDYDEQYLREDTAVLQKAGMEEKFERTDINKKRIFLPVLIIAVILAIVVFGLFQSPSTKEWIKKYIASDTVAIEKKAEKIIEEATPVKEEKKAPAIIQAQKPREQQEGAGGYYTVQVKDDLVSISEKLLNDYSRWKELYEANRDIIKDPYVIFAGQRLKIPSKDRKK